MSDEQKKEEDEIIADEVFYKRMLFNNMASLKNIDGRIDNLVSEINQADPEAGIAASLREAIQTVEGALDIDGRSLPVESPILDEAKGQAR